MNLLYSTFQAITGVFSKSFDEHRSDYSNRFYAGSNETQIHIKKENVPGIVSFFNSNKFSGRVNGCINFDSKTNITFETVEHKINVGSNVQMDMIRNTKISPWFITKMNVLSCPNLQNDSDWDNEESDKDATSGKTLIVNKDENLASKQVGMITYSNNGDLTLNNSINFRQKDCGVNSFPAVKGDWVVVQFDHEIRRNKIISIVPLRYVDYEGRISNFDRNRGYIEKSIFFTSTDRSLRRGNIVYGTAIESVQGRNCNFRALTIFLKKKSVTNNCALKMRVKTMDNEINYTNPKLLGLEINGTNLEFGELNLNTMKSKEITIVNRKENPLVINDLHLNNETNDQFIVEDVKGYTLLQNDPLVIQVRCKPQFPGLDIQKLLIECEDHQQKQSKIMLDLTVYGVDPLSEEGNENNIINAVQNVKPVAIPSSENISGIYLPAAKPLKITTAMTKMYPHKLKSYPIPDRLEHIVISKEDVTTFYPVLKEPLNPGNYEEKINLLIHLEEINTKDEMKEFIMEDVRMLSRRETFGIEVPGLTEGRPSLMVGDKVIVKLNGTGNTNYPGTIEEILSNCIFAKFHPNLHASYTNELCRISFEHTRLPYRRMHLGVEMACSNLGDDIIFPKYIIKKSSQCVRLSKQGINELSAVNFVKEPVSNLLHLKFYNSNLNELQRVAVIRMVHGYARPLPYVLFGPPGTGKTVTLVEAVLQVYKNVPSSRILLCTPSNSAADLVCLRLHQSGIVEVGEMVRMNAYRRTILSEISDREPIPPKILPYCKSMDELSDIAMHRIIISTCISSGSLYQLGLKSGHISHVFVDEAGQASEPEIMLCLGFIAPESGQIIIAGDPMQLGPVVRSKNAKSLEESYLHRLLLSCDLYRKQKSQCPGSTNLFNPLVVTQLLNNYRAHPSLLKLPSDMFYDGSLIARSGQEKYSFINWKLLPNPDVPLVFNSVRGKEYRNDRNPSTFNPAEAVMVVRWIGRVLQDSHLFGADFDYSHISVITPYKAQVDCIRKLIKSLLDDVNLSKLKVGSVEEFQGQENEVVVISTVRSSLEGNVNDGPNRAALNYNVNMPQETPSIMNTLGNRLRFLSNERRFNVSITRACNLMIVIGDPGLLQYDNCWSQLIKYAKDNKAYCGPI